MIRKKMKKTKKTTNIWILVMSVIISVAQIAISSDSKHFDTQVSWNNPILWDRSIIHSNNFFLESGWDKASGSLASEISSDGRVLSDVRHLIASSRMIYGLAVGSTVEPRYLEFAKKQTTFLLKKMIKTDSYGSYFKSAVDKNGKSISQQNELIVNEQAYGLNGLVALYSVTKDPAILAKIKSLYESFYRRFHDSVNKGFYDKFDLVSGRPVETKSYNSTVYVATSFLVELAQLSTNKDRRTYVNTVEELADAVADHFPDPRTGWIVENFTADWRPDWRGWQKQTVDTPEGKKDYTIGVTGHNFQAAWFLMRAAEFTEISLNARTKYINAARFILTSMLNSRAIDRVNGGVFDVFKREDGQNMWHTNKAWWQQAEAILALTKADQLGLFNSRQANILRDIRNQIVTFYFDHFVDYQGGGEFPVVQIDGTPVLTENKGQLGTGSYHQVELGYFMKNYGAF